MWPHFKVRYLVRNMRAEQMISIHPERRQEPLNHVAWLLILGNEKLNAALKDLVEAPDHMVCHSTEDLEAQVFDNFLENMHDDIYLSKQAIMSSGNNMINRTNSNSPNTCLKEGKEVTVEVDALKMTPPHFTIQRIST